MKEAILYYFSGSGNTFKVAKKVKNTLEQHDYKCVLDRIEDVKNIDFNTFEYVGLLFPVALQSTFPIVWDFIEGLPTTQGQKIFMIDTMEQFSGGVVGPVKRVLKSKGYYCVGALEVKMNSSMQTKEVDVEKINMKNSKAIESAERFISEMLKGSQNWHRVPVLSDWMRSISKSRKLWTKTSERIGINHDRCIKCNICIRDCPVEAMHMIEGNVKIDHSICNSCMRCVHHCPKDAFTLSGKKVIRYEY